MLFPGNSYLESNRLSQCLQCSLSERNAGDGSEKWMKTTECSAKNLMKAPKIIPEHTQALLVDENMLNDFDCFLEQISLSILEEIVLTGNLFTSLNSNRTLTSVVSVDASNNALTEISVQDLKSFPNLTQLSLAHNAINHIDKSLCSSEIPSVRTLILSYNLIENLDWTENCTAFKFIQLLDLSGNKQKDPVVHDFSFSSLQSVETLRMEDMNLTSIQNKAFSGLDNLKELNLDQNFLVAIPAKPFSKLTNLKSLTLSGNLIKRIEAGDFCHLPSIQFIDLTNMPFLQIIDQNSFQNLPKLERLLLSNNRRLSYIDGNAFENCTKVDTLELRKTLIETVLKTTIESLPSLKELKLGENPLNCNCMMKWAKEWADSTENDQGKILHIFSTVVFA